MRFRHYVHESLKIGCIVAAVGAYIILEMSRRDQESRDHSNALASKILAENRELRGAVIRGDTPEGISERINSIGELAAGHRDRQRYVDEVRAEVDRYLATPGSDPARWRPLMARIDAFAKAEFGMLPTREDVAGLVMSRFRLSVTVILVPFGLFMLESFFRDHKRSRG